MAHELDGQKLQGDGGGDGVSVNTLLSQKRYAVLHLRERLLQSNENFAK